LKTDHVFSEQVLPELKVPIIEKQQTIIDEIREKASKIEEKEKQ
jgi:hypothetical protein